MASKDENLRGVSGRRALASMLGFDTAQTYKLTADVAGGIVPALSPVVIAKDGTGKVYTADDASITFAETDVLGFTVSERRAETDKTLNCAVLRQAHVRRKLLSKAGQAALSAAPATALTHIIIEEN